MQLKRSRSSTISVNSQHAHSMHLQVAVYLGRWCCCRSGQLAKPWDRVARLPARRHGRQVLVDVIKGLGRRLCRCSRSWCSRGRLLWLCSCRLAWHRRLCSLFGRQLPRFTIPCAGHSGWAYRMKVRTPLPKSY